MSFTKSNGLLTAALMLSVGATVNAFAQQAPESEGIVRITDGKSRSNGGPAANRIVQVNSQQAVQGVMPQPGAVGCPSGDCQGSYGYASGGCPHCHGRGCHGCLGGGMFREHMCHHSPDHGYSPPAKYPLHRRGVEYTNYYPQHWYGTGPGLPSQAPMVYAPTDTTQLGFYYQHVPFWQPQPNRLPERPIPAQWHILAPTVSASGFCRGGHFGRGNCQNGYCQGDYGTVYGTPVNSSPTVEGPSEVVPQIQTAPGQPTPAADPAAQQAPQALPGSPTLPDQGTAPNPLPSLQSSLPQLQSDPQTLVQTSNTVPAANAAAATNVPTMTLSKP